MRGRYRILIQVCATTIFLVLLALAPASAGSGDPMSRDVEFKESLAKQNDTRESAISGSAYRFFPRRTYPTKRTPP
jgi:hypothetical protein